MRTSLHVSGITGPEPLGEIPEGGSAGFQIGIPGSPRSLAMERVPALIEALPSGVEAWGVVRDPSAELIRRVYEEVGVDRIVVYGPVPAGLEFLEIHHLVPSLPVGAPGSGAELPKVPPAEDYPRLHLDRAGTPDRDGHAERPDWEACAKLVDLHPGRKFVLAGGITAENAGEALATVRPWGLAVGAVVESAPGRIDLAKLRAVRQAIEAHERTAGSG